MKAIKTLLLLCFAVSLHAQEHSETRKYVPIKLGLQFIHVKDAFLSPNLHRGRAYTFGSGQETYRRNSIDRTDVDFTFGTTKSVTQTKYKQKYNHILQRTNYEYLYEVQTGDYQLFAGLQFKISFGVRTPSAGGNGESFAAYASLAAVGTAVYNDGSWRYEGNARLPLLAYTIRPMYGSSGHFLSENQFKTANRRLLTVPRFFAFELGANATKFTEVGSAFRFNYNMNYQYIKSLGRYKALHQDLNFTLLWRYK